jgi:hypothetical protein
VFFEPSPAVAAKVQNQQFIPVKSQKISVLICQELYPFWLYKKLFQEDKKIAEPCFYLEKKAYL